MTFKIPDIWELIKAGLISFWDTNPDLVRFESLGLAFGAGLFIALTLLYKLLWGRNKFSYAGSGHKIDKEYHQGKLSKFVFLVPLILLTAGVSFMLVSLAKPYLPKSTIEQIVESREILYLFDASSSKGWLFKNTGKSAGQLGREAVIKFLNMRKGQNDRSSLWLFSTNPSKREDFIIDDDIFMLEVEDAPYVIVDKTNPGFPEYDSEDSHVDIVASRDKIQFVQGEGGTYLNPALDAVIEYFDNEGDKRIKQKALILETDAAVEADPEKQLRELQKRRIKLYLLHIAPNADAEARFNNLDAIADADELKKKVKQFGGHVYDIQDPRSLEFAYRDIDRLERSPVKRLRHLFNIIIYQRPLMVGIALILLAIGFGLIMANFGESP